MLSIRVGVAGAGCGAKTALELLHAVEIALHQTKSDQAKVTYFDSSMLGQAKAVHELENDLRVAMVVNATDFHRALNNREFFIEYQPIMDTRDGTVYALEALLRWNHPEKGVIQPNQFIPLAEEIRLMDVLGAWVLRRACLEAASWPANVNGTYPAVSINASASQFFQPELLVSTLGQALRDARLPPERVKIEVTESMAASMSTVEGIDGIHALGCKVALDDFGTGYSSLTQLQDLDLDYIKVDRAFIKNIGSADEKVAYSAGQLAKAILMICEVMHFEAIFEGVEEPHQLALVEGLGAHLIQGFIFSRPMAPDDVPRFMGQLIEAEGKLSCLT